MILLSLVAIVAWLDALRPPWKWREFHIRRMLLHKRFLLVLYCMEAGSLLVWMGKYIGGVRGA